MKNDDGKKKERYIKLLSLLHLQTYQFNQMKIKSIKDNPQELICYLVNKDMIDNYKDLSYYNSISNIVDYIIKKKPIQFDNLFEEQVLKDFINKVGIDLKKIEPLEKKLIPTFLETETLKIMGYYYPYNFFLIRKEVFEYLFENPDNIPKKEFKEYKVLIGKEGVFIWNATKEKVNENGYIFVFFLNDLCSEINKIYLYKEEEDFKNELNNNIIGKKIKEYFLFRNIKNIDEGLFNLINDGKIMGKYINLFRIQNLVEEENIKEELKKNFDPMLKVGDKKVEKINGFLKYLLINLFYIKDLREYSKLIINKESSLLGAYNLFAQNFNENINTNLEQLINNFIKVFKEKSLGDTVFFNEENKNKAFEKLIENVIDSFNKESNQISKSNKNTNEINENKIFDLFYGEKSVKQNNNNNNNQDNKKKVFSTLYLNLNNIMDGSSPTNLNFIMDINNLKNMEIEINKLPNLLIIVLENNNLIEIPFILNIRYGYYKKDYKFLSSIRKDDNNDNYFSIVKMENELHKIIYNSNKNTYENEICDRNELNKSIIFFYETTMKEEIYTSGNNDIFGSNQIFASSNTQPNNNISNNFIMNNEGYQDINNTGNSVYNQYYNNNNFINNNNIINNNIINNNFMNNNCINNNINNNFINNGNIQNMPNNIN